MEKHLIILQDTLTKYEINAQNIRQKRLDNLDGTIFPKQLNNRILDAFAPFALFDRAPVWMMRQAGRYLPEFMAIRKEYSFFEACENPFIASEITLQPTKRFDIDAAIIFADILTLPKVMGMEIVMEEAKGPVIKNPLVEAQDIERVTPPQNGALDHVYDALFLTRLALQGKQTLIGFCGGPWTVFSYMIEGGSSVHFLKVKKWLYQKTEATQKVLELLGSESAKYLINQVKSGAQVVQIFDSWAGKISPQDYVEFVLPSVKNMLSTFKKECPNTPVIMFPKDQCNSIAINEMLAWNVKGVPLVDGFQLDAAVEDEVILKIIQSDRTLQGNLEPGVLFGNHHVLKKRVSQMIEKLQVTRKYIVNLAHGLTPEHTVDSVKQFVNEAQRQSKLFKVREVLE